MFSSGRQVTTSTVVGLVASASTNASVLSFNAAVPIIIGANVGTTITNTVLSLSLYRERKQLRWAFCAGSMHDIFNFLTASLVLPCQHLYSFMEPLTNAVVDFLSPENDIQGWQNKSNGEYV